LKLLRVIQEKELERVGDSHPIKVDVRIITSTNQPLKQKVKKGEFREDLYYRLKVVEVILPPLRERRDDIELLVIHFCDLFNTKFGKNIEGITDDVLKAFMNYPWPGNIRELEHAIEHAFVLCHENVITIDHIPSEMREHKDSTYKPSGGKDSEEIRKITDALKQAEWNKAKAARLLGISRQTLYRKIKEKNITEHST
jgi:transcriptional regulator with PAS, ATPase and Fis domain